MQNTSYAQETTDIGNGAKTTTLYDEYYAFIRIMSGTVANNLVFKPMLNRGSQVRPFRPYKKPVDILTIPETVKSLEGYGLGVNYEYYNYIDFNRKLFVQNVKMLTLTGTETFNKNSYFSNANGYSTIISDYKSNIQQGVCSHFSTIGWSDQYATDGIIFGTQINIVTPIDKGLDTVDAFKAYVAEQYANNTPITIVYCLAEPIETDISEYLTEEYIEVEDGGTITAINEYAHDAPTNIAYLVDTQGE